jgi:hypothetical protein
MSNNLHLGWARPGRGTKVSHWDKKTHSLLEMAFKFSLDHMFTLPMVKGVKGINASPVFDRKLLKCKGKVNMKS